MGQIDFGKVHDVKRSIKKIIGKSHGLLAVLSTISAELCKLLSSQTVTIYLADS
jgi:hypothetical protein